MKNWHSFLLICTSIVLSFSLKGQGLTQYQYDSSEENPFGLPNPDAPEQIKDFHPLIGENTCRSVARNPDQTWGDTLQMLWRWKYIANGMAVQDESLKEDGNHSGSIRQFIPDSNRWFVHF